jgi:hypothetical protein
MLLWTTSALVQSAALTTSSVVKAVLLCPPGALHVTRKVNCRTLAVRDCWTAATQTSGRLSLADSPTATVKSTVQVTLGVARGSDWITGTQVMPGGSESTISVPPGMLAVMVKVSPGTRLAVVPPMGLPFWLMTMLAGVRGATCRGNPVGTTGRGNHQWEMLTGFILFYLDADVAGSERGSLRAAGGRQGHHPGSHSKHERGNRQWAPGRNNMREGITSGHPACTTGKRESSMGTRHAQQEGGNHQVVDAPSRLNGAAPSTHNRDKMTAQSWKGHITRTMHHLV